MYFAPTSPIDRAVLLIRYGLSHDEVFFADPGEIADEDDPMRKAALERAHACARRKGFIL